MARARDTERHTAVRARRTNGRGSPPAARAAAANRDREAARAINGHIEACAPWTLSKQGKKEEVAGVLYRSADALRIVAVLLAPFVPSAAKRILEQLWRSRSFTHICSPMTRPASGSSARPGPRHD